MLLSLRYLRHWLSHVGPQQPQLSRGIQPLLQTRTPKAYSFLYVYARLSILGLHSDSARQSHLFRYICPILLSNHEQSQCLFRISRHYIRSRGLHFSARDPLFLCLMRSQLTHSFSVITPSIAWALMLLVFR